LRSKISFRPYFECIQRLNIYSLLELISRIQAFAIAIEGRGICGI
jgi:hypothetical protein